VTKSLSSQEAAVRLGLTRPTVRSLLERGELAGEKEQHGDRFIWRIDPAAVEACAVARAVLKRPGRTSVADLRERIVRLESAVAALGEGDPGHGQSFKRTGATTDASAMLQLRAVMAAHQQADEARAQVVTLLLKALTAAERADEQRRAALTAAETLLGEYLMPPDTSGLTAGDGASQ
jgi:excisionase family DNA binding protein